MALPRFPLKQFLNDGYREEIQTTYIETTPDAGTQIRRQTNTDANKFVDGSITLSDFEKNLLLNFYLNDTASGSLQFIIYDCLNDVDRVARFINKPNFNRNSNYWNVQYQLQLEPTTVTENLALITESGLLITTEDEKSLIAEVKLNV